MTTRRTHLGALVLFLLAAVVLVLGWKLFWFLCDDAFISFRYIDNHLRGNGYVWNPAPFRPVEGYTNFLWMVVLEGIWRVLDVPPPESCNVVSLGFSILTLVLVGFMMLRLRMNIGGRRLVLLGLVYLGIVTNRTFLAWSSSGLETAMFNFFILSWIYVLLFLPGKARLRLFLLSASAALIYLTRPDGLLFVGATVLVLLLRLRNSPGRRSVWAAWLPLIAVPAHLLWRRNYYGEWLPNSYYAKTAGMWPESGGRYLLSFVLEYALWLWVGCLLLLVWKRLREKSGAKTDIHGWERRIGVAAVFLHAAYYIVIVGGDHFEYRVLSHLVPLVMISWVWMLSELRAGPRTAVTVLSLAVLLSLPVPTLHWLASRNLNTREETLRLRVPVAEHLPPGIDVYGKVFDHLQFWLIEHYVCMRHQEHKINLEYTRTLFPSREEGLAAAVAGYPILGFPAVGYASWVLPHIAILDTFGLNDYVVARTPLDPEAERRMAHERRVPRGYLECLAPNVRLLPEGGVEILQRKIPMTADRVRECETRWAESVTGP